jgi:hypothetical protein
LQRPDLLAWAWRSARNWSNAWAGARLILPEPNLPDGHGPERLEELRRLHPRSPVVVLSGSELSGEQLSLVDAALGKTRLDTQHVLTILARLLPAKEPFNA